MEISTEVSQKSKNMFGSIVYTFNCNYSEDGDQEDQGSKPVQEKIETPPSQQIWWAWWCAPVTHAISEA
jgi:hypothetical protein